MAKQPPTVEDVLKLAAEVDESAIDAEIAALEDKLKKLKDAKATISVLKHGKPARKVGGPRKKKSAIPPSDQTKSIKQRIIDRLEIQPAKPAIIAADTGLGMNQVQGALANYPDVFKRAMDGNYTLANGAAY